MALPAAIQSSVEEGLIVDTSLGRVILAYKNFAASKNISHIGLGVAALNTAKTLRANGIAAEVWPIVSARGFADTAGFDDIPCHHIRALDSFAGMAAYDGGLPEYQLSR